MSPITINQIIRELTQYVRDSWCLLDLILGGGLALQAYGYADWVTMEVEGEIAGDLNSLMKYLQARNVPADLGENMSEWSVVPFPAW